MEQEEVKISPIDLMVMQKLGVGITDLRDELPTTGIGLPILNEIARKGKLQPFDEWPKSFPENYGGLVRAARFMAIAATC